MASPRNGKLSYQAMLQIEVPTIIRAAPDLCFDMARDMRLHEHSASRTSEKVVLILRDGAPLNLRDGGDWRLVLGDEVTFEARHLGVRQRLSSKIVKYDRPHIFIDEMVRGAFKSLRHVHRFEATSAGTLMTDELVLEAPYGLLGAAVEQAFLGNYMRRFLAERGAWLARCAEERSEGE